MIVGITGLIGSGKSTAAKMLREWGGALVDADQIGRDVVEQSTTLRRKLASQFGADILTPSGRLRRAKLAERAFADDRSVEKLNKLVHPYLLKQLRKKSQQLSKKNKVVIIDAALLLNWNLDREVDLVLMIHASRKIRLQRLITRGIAKEDALARESRQLPYSEYRFRADRTIFNSGTVTELRRKLKLFWNSLNI